MGFYCDGCQRAFNTYRACDQHCYSTGHGNPIGHYQCQIVGCYEDFGSSGHRREHHENNHQYCEDCDRFFQSDNNLRQHLNSRTHRGASIDCPFCRKGYTTATGLCHHLETSSCPNAPSLNRDQIYKIIRSRDGGLITKNLIEYQSSAQYDLDPEDCWNGYQFECPMCDRVFNTPHGVYQHVQSAAHQQALYHCPGRGGCGKEFKNLAGLINHFESESCGYVNFDVIQRSIQNVISGDRRIAFR